MWSFLVIVLPPLLNHDLDLLQAVKDFSIEQFVPELAVEALAVAVLSWTSRLDE